MLDLTSAQVQLSKSSCEISCEIVSDFGWVYVCFVEGGGGGRAAVDLMVNVLVVVATVQQCVWGRVYACASRIESVRMIGSRDIAIEEVPYY